MSMQSICKAEVNFNSGQCLKARRINKVDWLITVYKGKLQYHVEDVSQEAPEIQRKLVVTTSQVETISRLGRKATSSTKLGMQSIPRHQVTPVCDAVSQEVTSWIKEKAASGKLQLSESFDVSDINELVERMLKARMKAHRRLAVRKRESVGFAQKGSGRV